MDTKNELHEMCLGIAKEIESAKSIFDYFENALDIRYEIDGKCKLCGGRILVTYGGPNIWVHEDCVKGYWGVDKVEIALNERGRNAVWEFLSELNPINYR